MSNTSGYNKDFREWSESIMIRQNAAAYKLLRAIKRLREESTKRLKAEVARLENELLEARKANREMAKVAMERYFEIKRLKENIEKKDKDIDDLNASLFKVTQESMEKDKTIKALEEQVMELKLSKGNKLFLLDDEGVPIKSFTLTGKLTLMEEPAKEKLERNKWYRASDFDIDELKEKLGLGVLVEVIRHPTEDKDEMRPELREVRTERVHFILKNGFGKTALSTGSAFYRNWFRVI